MMGNRVLLFDLDGTLLQSDKHISQITRDALRACRKRGYLLGIATSRSEKSALPLVEGLDLDIRITSCGALVEYHGTYIHKVEFTMQETEQLLQKIREQTGGRQRITVDTMQGEYYNYGGGIQEQSHYTDFNGFQEKSFRICVELQKPELAAELAGGLSNCNWIKFLGGDWYQLARREVTKAYAIQRLCQMSGLSISDFTAFGDDLADIGMLQLCGWGIAMGNALKEVKRVANQVIGNNDEDGIAAYLMENLL